MTLKNLGLSLLLNIKEVNAIRTTKELANCLYETFRETDSHELDSYTDTKIAQHIRARFGSDELKEYDKLDRKQWIEAWGIFSHMVKLNRKSD